MRKERVFRSRLILFGQITFVTLLLGFLEYATKSGLVGKLYFAAPTSIGSTLINLFLSEEFYSHLEASFYEFITGYTISVVLGIGFGLLIALVDVIDEFTRPYINAIMAIQKETLIPLLIIALGIGYKSIVVYLVLFCIFPILLNTVAGVKEASANHIKVARSLGATQLVTIRKVLIPSALPAIFAGLRISAAHGIIGTLLSEMIASERGIGNILVKAAAQFDTERLLALVIFVTAISVLIIQAIDLLEKRAFLRWKQNT